MSSLSDLINAYNTQLSPQEEKRFSQWATRNGRQGDLEDYDLRGAWKADAQSAANGHLPDTWKKPNHPTFSSESMYNSPGNEGGRWTPAGNDKWVFWASPSNMKYRGIMELMDYFNRVEPGNQVVLPYDYRLPGGQ